MTKSTKRTRTLHGHAGALVRVMLLAGAVGACTAEAAPPPAPTPPPTPIPAPTATPLPGTPLPASYRPDGEWTVTFALPGDFIRETWRIKLKCPKGACDAVVEIRDAKGKKRGKAKLALQDGRYVLRTTTTATIDCRAGGSTVKGGATRRTETDVVLATYRLAGTAIDRRSMAGHRTIEIEPQGDSGCSASRLVYPASGERSDP